jgi:hypothetical protein
MQPRRSTDHGFYLPATFHPQGLATLSVVCSLQGLADFVSRRQRSWEVPFGAFSSPEVPGRFRPSGLTYRSPQRFLRRPKAPARPDGSRFLSFDPLENPLRPDVSLIHRSPEAPVGFPPSRVRRKQPPPGFRRKSSRVLGRHGPQAAACTSEYQSVAAWFPPQQGTRPSTDETTLLGFRAKSLPSIQSQEIFGLWVHLTPP